MRFQRQLLLTYAGMALFPTVLLVLVTYHLISQSIERWADYQIALTLVDAEKLAYQLELYENRPLAYAAELLAVDADLVMLLETGAGLSGIHRRMTQLADAHQEYVLALYDASGSSIYSTHPDLPPANLTTFLYSLGKLPDNPTTSEELKDQGLLISGMPIFSEDGTQRLGAIVVGKFVPTTTVQVREQLVNIESRLDTPAINIGKLVTDFGKDSARFKRVEKRLTFILLLITAVIIAVLSFWLSRVLANGINKPIQSLVTGTEQIAGGNLNYEVKARGKDEFGALAGAFNQMVGDLRVRTEKLKRAEKIAAWQDIAQKLAHEIKNPLTPIQLSAQRLHRQYHNNSSDFALLLEQCTQTIITEVNGLRYLLDQFSQLARMPAPELSSVKLSEIIHATIDILGEFPSHVNVRLDVSPELPPVEGDTDQLKRAFLNLIKNALEAMDEASKGTLTIRAFTATDKSKVFVHVTDTGVGISDDMKLRLFTPHFSTKKYGTGLGLTIVKKILMDLGGDVYLEEARSGQLRTTFALWLNVV